MGINRIIIWIIEVSNLLGDYQLSVALVVSISCKFYVQFDSPSSLQPIYETLEFSLHPTISPTCRSSTHPTIHRKTISPYINPA